MGQQVFLVFHVCGRATQAAASVSARRGLLLLPACMPELCVCVCVHVTRHVCHHQKNYLFFFMPIIRRITLVSHKYRVSRSISPHTQKMSWTRGGAGADLMCLPVRRFPKRNCRTNSTHTARSKQSRLCRIQTAPWSHAYTNTHP